MNYPIGTFETHITVSSSTDHQRFGKACTELGIKAIAIDIDLPLGDARRQPMTGSFLRGTLATVKLEADELGRELTRRGFEVVRTKIEEHGRLENAPDSDEVACLAPSTSYFEYHAKLTLPVDADVEALRRALAEVGGHLSANAASRGSGDRFLTLRAYRLGRPNAEKRFQRLLTAVADLGLGVRSRVREYCVYDSNPTVDHGWAEAPSP